MNDSNIQMPGIPANSYLFTKKMSKVSKTLSKSI